MCCCGEEPFKTTIKGLVFALNFLFWLSACGLSLVGGWAFMEKSKFTSLSITSIYDIMFDASIVLMVVGGVIFFVTFTGCIGALRENNCLLTFYIVVMAILLLLQIGCGVFIFVFRGRVKDAVGSVLVKEGIVRYRDDPDLQNIFDWTQEKFQCCGVGPLSYKEWSMNPYFNCSDKNPSSERCAVPFSCCIKQFTFENGLPNLFCGYGVQEMKKFQASETSYILGCMQVVIDTALMNYDIVGSTIVGVAGIQIISAMLAVILRNEIQQSDTVYPRYQ